MLYIMLTSLNIIILPYEGNSEEIHEKEVVETPKQDRQWTEYNLYQTQERILAYKIINDVVNYLQLQNKPINGRPSVEINDMIKSLLVKAYNNISARRLNSELIMCKVCCHNISVLVEAMMLYNAKPHF